MVPIPDLWLPIVVSAAFVFVLSSILHMVLTYHRADYKQLPMEDETIEAIRRAGPGPGLYVFPYCPSSKEMGTPEMKAKLARGPVGLVTIKPSGIPNLGAYLGTWFGFCLLAWGFVVGFVAGWFSAFTRNFVIAASLWLSRTRNELEASRDFLDHI